MAEPIRSSLPLQLLLFLNWPFLVLYMLLEVALFIYKGARFSYEPWRIGVEVAMLFLYCLIDILRIQIASYGNKTEQVPQTAVSVVLAVAPILLYIYFYRFQVYVLRIDQVLNIIALVIVCLEVVLGAVAAFRFYRGQRY